jgi:hypothetical protein
MMLFLTSLSFLGTGDWGLSGWWFHWGTCGTSWFLWPCDGHCPSHLYSEHQPTLRRGRCVASSPRTTPGTARPWQSTVGRRHLDSGVGV